LITHNNISVFNISTYGKIFNSLSNGSDYRKYTNQGINFIKVADINNLQINIENSKKITEYIDKYTGMTMPNITQPNLKSIQIPLPPLAIQNKIVTHIENIKNEIKDLNHQAQQNKALALSEFEAEIFDVSP
jgi:restriction endonuclease S subunit